MLFCLSPVYANSGASNFCHIRLILPGCPSDFAKLSDQFWDRNFPISLSDFVQCDVRRSDAHKNRMESLAKSVRQQKLDWFWLFPVNDPLWNIKSCLFTSVISTNQWKSVNSSFYFDIFGFIQNPSSSLPFLTYYEKIS